MVTEQDALSLAITHKAPCLGPGRIDTLPQVVVDKEEFKGAFFGAIRQISAGRRKVAQSSTGSITCRGPRVMAWQEVCQA